MIVLIPFAALASAPRAPGDWVIERQEWSEVVAEGQAVSVTNRFGDVRLRGIDEARFSGLGMVQHHALDPRQAAIVISRDADGVHLEVRWNDGDQLPQEAPEAWRKRRVDLTVYVPAAAALQLQTLDGTIWAEDLQGDVEVESKTGDVEIKTRGSLRGGTDHGKLWTTFVGAGWARPAQLETVTGEIQVQLPRQTRVRALLETRGDITTDYSIRIEKEPGSGLKKGEAVIGKDGPELHLRSGRGALKLLESERPD